MALHYAGPVTPFYGKGILVGLVEPALQELGAITPLVSGGVTGYSLGGSGTWYLAARNQFRFAAAIPMAGWPQPDSADVRWEIPLYVIHSRQDEVVPFEQTAKVVRQLEDRAVAVQCMWLQNVTHYETGYFVEPLRATAPWIRKVWKTV